MELILIPLASETGARILWMCSVCPGELVNTARHPGLRTLIFRWRQIVIRVASGMYWLHNLNTSGVHAFRSSSLLWSAGAGRRNACIDTIATLESVNTRYISLVRTVDLQSFAESSREITSEFLSPFLMISLFRFH